MLSAHLRVSRQYVHRIVKELLDRKVLMKMGRPPHVVYNLAMQSEYETALSISYSEEQFLAEHFLIVNALGHKLHGLAAMKYWCENQGLPLKKTLTEYILTRKKYLAYYDDEHLINGAVKLQNTKGIGEIGLDELYYLDFYAIERFGKTHLGCLMHYAKQGQNKNLMRIIAQEIRNRIQNVITKHEIDALLFVPPTIQRKVQIMDFLEQELNLDMPTLQVKKVSNEIIIPQKALSKLFERVANARNTFIVPKQKSYSKILIIDDAIGSGATMNEISLKVKAQNLAEHIVGIALTGSYKGFEVISEL